MKKENSKYYMVMSNKMSSKDDIKAFARDILLSEGVDIDLIKINEDGIKISSFSKLVRSLYELGYKHGFDSFNDIKGERKRLENEGRILTKHQRTAKVISEQNLMNK